MSRFGAFTAALFAAICLFSSAQAQEQPRDGVEQTRARMANWVTTQPGFFFPENRGELDRLLDGRHFAELTTAMRTMGTTAKGTEGLLNWQVYRVMTGGGFWITNQYAITLWNVGLANARGGGPSPDGFKGNAVRYALYSMAVIEIDSLSCQDRTAGPKHRERLLQRNAELMAYAKTMPLPLRQKLLQIVPDMEMTLAPLRPQDDDLCRYGDEEFLAAMGDKKLDDFTDCKQVPGLPGKTCDIVMPQSYTPKRRELAETFLDQVTRRLEMYDELRRLLDLPADAK